MPELSLLLPMAAMILAIGAFAGVLAGLLGVGGGIVLVPAFFYAFRVLGYDSPDLMQLCLGTSLATIIVTSLRSGMAHHRKGAVDWEILRGWAPGIVVGAIAGVALVAGLSSRPLQAIFGALAIVVGLYMTFGRSNWRLGERMPDGPLRWVLSPLVGFLSVLMGIGGGSFGVPLMTLYGVPIHRAVATAAFFGLAIAMPSVVGFLMIRPEVVPPFTLGAVNGVAFLLVIAMTLITAPLGARLAHWMEPGPLKRVFGLFLTAVALNMIYEAVSAGAA